MASWFDGPTYHVAVKGSRRAFGSSHIILYYKVYNSNCYQVGQDLIDHVHCIDASMQEHETLSSSRKMCLQIVAVTFICSGKD